MTSVAGGKRHFLLFVRDSLLFMGFILSVDPEITASKRK